MKTIYRPCPEIEDKATDTVLKLTKKSLLVYGQGVISETHKTEKSDDKKPIVLSKFLLSILEQQLVKLPYRERNTSIKKLELIIGSIAF